MPPATPGTWGPPAAASPEPAGSPPVPGSTPPASPPLPKRFRTYAAAGGVVAIVIVALFVTLIATGTLHVTGSNNSSGPLTYSQAAPIAAQSASGYGGGGWAPVVAFGIDSAAAESYPVNSSGTSNCTFSLAPGAPGAATVPAYSGSRTAGAAPAWEFLFRNGANTILLVLVIDGSAVLIGTVGGGICGTIFALFSAIPSSVIDSSQAGAAIASRAASFLAEYPNASATYGLTGGVSFLGRGVGAEWGVALSTCPPGPPQPGTGSEFNATVNATSGAVSYNATQTSRACTGSTIGLTIPRLIEVFALAASALDSPK